MRVRNPNAVARPPTLHYASVFVPPTCPRRDGDVDKEECRAGRSGNDLGAGSTVCDGGVDKRLREEGFYASLSLPIFGKTEVARELD
jgi:hypothetical protein